MKILQVVHSFVPYAMAGTEIYTYKLSKELLKKNKVFVFFRINNAKEKEYYLLGSDFEGLETYAINHTFRFCHSFEQTYIDTIIDRKFGDLLDKIKPDVVHLQHLLFLSHGIIHEIKNRNIPIVYTLHDYWLICYRGQLIKEDLTICKINSFTECKTCLRYALNIKGYAIYLYILLRRISHPSILGVLKRFYLMIVKTQSSKKIERLRNSLRDICSKIDLFIAPSNFVKNKFLEYGIPQEKIIYSPYGFDKLVFSYVPKKTPCNNRLIFGYIGTLLPMKGVDILISAFKESKYENNIKLYIYGKLFSYSGFELYPKFLEKMISNDNRIKLMGGYENRDVGKILANIDVLVVPSIWLENAPLVIQEAFLSNTPVIASRIGGIPELVSDGVNGLLFNPGDVFDLQEKLQYIIDNPDVIERFKMNIPEVKSIEDNAKEIEEIYNTLIDNKRL